MAGRHPFSKLRKRLPTERRVSAKRRTKAMLEDLDLAELRRARKLSQEALAQMLDINQPAVAKLEKRADMYVSTLRRFVQAMGGDLEIVARFPDRTVRIRKFEELGEGKKVA
jgi:DNA-binding XRE family transcriptional regulator